MPLINGCVALALLGLAALVIIEAVRALGERRNRPVTSAAA